MTAHHADSSDGGDAPALRFGVLTFQALPFPTLLDDVRFVESIGLDAVWLGDQTYPEAEPILEAWTSLAALACGTKQIRIGTSVTNVAMRNPMILARQALTVDQISNGRLDVGLGAGWYEVEHTSIGIAFPDPQGRLSRLSSRTACAAWMSSVSKEGRDPLSLRRSYLTGIADEVIHTSRDAMADFIGTFSEAGATDLIFTFFYPSVADRDAGVRAGRFCDRPSVDAKSPAVDGVPVPAPESFIERLIVVVAMTELDRANDSGKQCGGDRRVDTGTGAGSHQLPCP